MRACARFACASARGGASEGRARAAPRGMATYVDVGANLTDGMFRGVYRGKRAHEDDLGAVLRRAREAGVSDIIVTAGTLEEAREAVALARETREDGAAPRLYATCGVHPTRCGAFADDVLGFAVSCGPLAGADALLDGAAPLDVGGRRVLARGPRAALSSRVSYIVY